MTLWAVAHQAPLSMEFPRQEDWSGLPTEAKKLTTVWPPDAKSRLIGKDPDAGKKLRAGGGDNRG